MNKKQAKNLAKCITALQESPNPKKFTMGQFINDPEEAPLLEDYCNIEDYRKNLINYVKEMEATNWCSSPACVLGHFGFRTDLQKLIKVDSTEEYSELIFKDGDSIDLEDERILEYFGITKDESIDLFSDHGCAYADTSTQAINYIKDFLKEKGYNWKDLV